MTLKNGELSVNTSDLLPIIKKWLYSEHDIFLRELVSNSCDAITKRATMARIQNLDMPEGKVNIMVSPDQKTVTICDNGIGMTEEEVQKYITTLAFSGAKDFAQKLKDEGVESGNEIIGKFGLGFYSAFMVSDKIEIQTLSQTKGATPVFWTSNGETEYQIGEGERKEVGTTITLFISEDSKNFLKEYELDKVLRTYCSYMPYSVFLFDTKRKKDNEETREKEISENKKEEELTPLYTETQINNPSPIWNKPPNELKDEDYKAFFREKYPYEAEPLFWIHLNVDHPFNLKGLLYFPKFNPTKPAQENNIELYSKQVFVSNNVKNVIPEFLSLLKGVIDSPDIPLNVSRSALQGDPRISKISNYILKKVAESLKKLFKADRQRYEAIWGDIGIFVKYGMIQNTKFDEYMRPYLIFESLEATKITLSEYSEKIPENYKDKLKGKVVYFNKKDSDVSLKAKFTEEKVPFIETDDKLDSHLLQHLEVKEHKDFTEKVKFSSIDEEFENIFDSVKAEPAWEKIKELFNKYIGDSKDEKKPGKLNVEVKDFGPTTGPGYLKVDSQMKRFKEMSKMMGQSDFDMPMEKTLILNASNNLVQSILKLSNSKENETVVDHLCHHVHDLALLSSEGLEDKNKEVFIHRSESILSKLTEMVL